MISQELTSIKERGLAVLSRMLKNEKGGSSTDLLLIIKRWGEFFRRFRKNNPVPVSDQQPRPRDCKGGEEREELLFV